MKKLGTIRPGTRPGRSRKATSDRSRRRLRRWYVVTFLMGLFFILGQGYEYYHLTSHGTTIPGSAYGTVFYLATGFHGLHVTGGLIAFIFLLARTTMSKFTPAQATASIVVSYYWHFVDIVWIALFATIYFIR